MYSGYELHNCGRCGVEIHRDEEKRPVGYGHNPVYLCADCDEAHKDEGLEDYEIAEIYGM